MVDFVDRLVHGWNAFVNPEETPKPSDPFDYNPAFGFRPDRQRQLISHDRSIVASIYNQISIDVAAVNVYHARTDGNGRFLEVINSYLNDCLTTEANLDQSGRALIQDAVLTLCEEGVIAIVPVDTTINPKISGGYDIQSLRVGTIVGWYPDKVKVKVYNEKTGRFQEVVLRKRDVAIVENPLYSVMNEPNSTLKRLLYKLSLLDSVDEQMSSGKLDLIIQLPYVVKTEARREQANMRRKDIEDQLKGSKYGIAYTDGTEKITQLNRPAENNLHNEVVYLTGMLYSQLGLSETIFNGTADEKTMLNYYNRTVEPILAAIVDGMNRSFLTKTARTQLQRIMFLPNPFRLISVSELADVGEKLTRNEILSSNEMRALMGFKPVATPQAEELRNKNLNPTSVPQVEAMPPSVSPADLPISELA